MWTPRRMMLGFTGLLCFIAVYLGYVSLLGGYDGLPPLPVSFVTPPDPSSEVISRPVTMSNLDRRLEMAFGPGCREMHFAIKIEIKPKGIVFAGDKFEIIRSGPRAGWVELTPVSVAIFGKNRSPEGIAEINTLYSDVAYVQFDRPVRSISELEGKKVVTAELHADPEAKSNDPRKGRIIFNNNRKTLDENDDLEFQTLGPVYYVEDPKPGLPNIFTQNAIQLTDHLNTNLPKPDRKTPRVPTVTGLGLKMFLANDPPPAPKDQPKKVEPKKTPGKKEPKSPVSGIELVMIETNVEMNLFTDENTDLSGQPPEKKKEPAPKPKEDPAAKPKDGQKTPPAPPVPEKKLIQIKTNGPFTYDMKKELAHFEKPAVQKPGIVEHVTVTRSGKSVGQELLDCEFLDVFFQRKQTPPPVGKDGKPAPVAKKAAEEGNAEGNMEVKLIRAWGETVVITSDAENLHATGAELIHDGNAKMTILKGNAAQRVQAVKDGNLLQGSELHIFSDGKELSQAHVFGPGSVGMGEVDPKTGEYFRQAVWGDRLVFSKTIENGKPYDVLTFIGKVPGGPAIFSDKNADGQASLIQANQLKVWLIPAPPADSKKETAKKDPAKKDLAKAEPKQDISKGAKVFRLEATGDVRSSSADVVIKRADYLNVWFKDVPVLIKPPTKKIEPKKEFPKVVVKIDVPPLPGEPKAPVPVAKKEPPKDKKQPLIVVAKNIETWVNRDPKGETELDRVHAEIEVDIHQDPNGENDQGVDINGKTVDMKAYAEGNQLVVTGDPNARPEMRWGVVRFDKLTMFGQDIVIDQRTNTAVIKGEGSMEMLTGTDLEGRKLEKPSMVTIYWKQRMDFFGADKLVYYHGAVQAYQEASRLKCEWMQVQLDKPVLLSQEGRDKLKAQQVKGKEENDAPKIDTVMCFHEPKDENIPRPKVMQPVVVIEETKVGDKVMRFQSIQAPEVMSVNTPTGPNKTAHQLTVTSSETMPGVVRLWQPGSKDGGLSEKSEPKPAPKGPPKKKGELREDEEMKLTVVQFGGKMQANDLRKRAVFFNNVKVVNLPAETPNLAVDLRQGSIPKGAVYLEARDQLEVFSTVQKEKDPTGKQVEVSYQEMIARGNVRVRKQGEFFGDADWVSYSELKGVLIFYGTKESPAVINKQRGQGIKDETIQGERIKYYTRTKTFEVEGGTTFSQ